MHSIATSAAGARRWSRPLVAPWTIVALVLMSLWAPPLVATAGFALVSAAALRELTGRPFALRASGLVHPRERPFGRTGQRTPVLLYLCVLLQYGFVASHAYGPMTLALPLVATLALPLWNVGMGDVRALAERSAQRYFAIMVGVYALSHVPALAMAGAGLSALFASWPLAIATAALVAFMALGGALVMARVGAPQLAYVGAVAFAAPPLYHFATWIASRTTG